MTTSISEKSSPLQATISGRPTLTVKRKVSSVAGQAELTEQYERVEQVEKVEQVGQQDEPKMLGRMALSNMAEFSNALGALSIPKTKKTAEIRDLQIISRC